MSIRSFVIVFLFAATTGLFAEDSAMDLEIRWGAGAFRNKVDLADYSDLYYTKQQDLELEIVGPSARYLGTPAEQIQAFLLANTAPDPSLKSSQLSLMLDYGISTNHSLGFELQHTEIEAENFGYSKILVGLGYILIYYSGSPLAISDQQIVQIENFLPYYRDSKKQFLRLDTANFTYSYHFGQTSQFAPFIRLRIGIGRESTLGYRVYRSGISLGSKWFLTNSIFLTTELGYENYTGVFEPTDYAWTLDNYSAQIGAGLRF